MTKAIKNLPNFSCAVSIRQNLLTRGFIEIENNQYFTIYRGLNNNVIIDHVLFSDNPYIRIYKENGVQILILPIKKEYGEKNYIKIIMSCVRNK